jgi:sugar-specific transcriptional regulator TrmB
MDQETYPPVITVVNATEDFIRDSLAKATLRIGELEEHIQKVTQRSYADSADRNRMVESMQEWTLEELSNETITESQAQEIAEIMGFDLTKEVEVEVTVTYNLTLQVPHDEDAESIVNDIDFESVSYNSDNITWLSASVDRIDF